jgi:DNA-binding IclR family transcriptional regulator
MSEFEREKIISEAERLTPKTILDRNALSGEIMLVRKRGYALSLDEYSEGFSSIAGPVVNDKDEALCTIAVNGTFDKIFRGQTQRDWRTDKRVLC